MPCYTVTRTQIELGVKTDINALHAALDALDMQPVRTGPTALYFAQGSFDKRTGTLTLDARGQYAQELAAKIKRVYGVECAKQTALAAGWQIEQVDPFTFDIVSTS